MKQSNHILRQDGFALLDALVALLVVAVGLLGIIKFQSQLFLNGAIGKQRSAATVLAQERLEALRSYVDASGYNVLAAVDGTPNDATSAIFGPTSGESITVNGTVFNRLTRITTYTAPYSYLRADVVVSWAPPSGAAESVTLAGAIAWSDPSQQGILIVGAPAAPSSDCSAQTVFDGLCSGPASATTNGSSTTVTYTAGGAGSGSWLCTSGAFSKTSGTCSANCAAATVSDDTCQGIVPATNHSLTATINYSSGGTGTATWLCSNGSWSKTSGTCSPYTCSWNNAIYSNGASVTAYTSQNPSTVCSSNTQTQTCTDGSWSPGGNFYPTCHDPCTLTLADGGSETLISGGSDSNIYPSPTNASCLSIKETVTCVAGGGTSSSLSPAGPYYRNCTSTSGSSCLLPNGATLNNGATTTLYRAANVPCPALKFGCDNSTVTCPELTDSICPGDKNDYSHTHCGCTYTQTLTFTGGGSSAKTYCATNAWTPPSGCSPPTGTASTAAYNPLTCTGTVSYGGSVQYILANQLKYKQGSNCNTVTATITCTPPSLTCSSDSTSLTTACTIPQ